MPGGADTTASKAFPGEEELTGPRERSKSLQPTPTSIAPADAQESLVGPPHQSPQRITGQPDHLHEKATEGTRFRRGQKTNVIDINNFNPKLRSSQRVPLLPGWLRRWLRAPGWAWTDAIASMSVRLQKPRSNFVSSRKYTGYNFLFKFLVEQYKSPSNIVFTFLMIINFLPGLNVVSGWTAVIPLAFILGVALVKDIIEEIARSRADRRENERKYSHRIRLGQIEEGATSESLMQGDILVLNDGDIAPCDMLYLGPLTTSAKRGRVRHPECVISTASLDGEQSLKKRHPLLTTGLFSLQDWARVTGRAVVDLPTADFKRCSGSIRLWKPELPLERAHEWPCAHSQLEHFAEDGGFSYSELTFGIQNVLLRGVKIAGQKPVVCLALYTGKNCKVFQSHSAPIRKRDAFDKQMNLIILFQFCVVVLLVLLLTLLYTLQLDKFKELYPYIGITDQSTASAFFQSLGVHFILLAYAVPFSIFVTLQLIRLLNGLGLFLSEKFRAEKAAAEKDDADDLQGMLDQTLARGKPVEALEGPGSPANIVTTRLAGSVREPGSVRDQGEREAPPELPVGEDRPPQGQVPQPLPVSGYRVEAIAESPDAGQVGGAGDAHPTLIVDVRETELAARPGAREVEEPKRHPVERSITIKDMSSVEKFSAVDIVFSDKTGTITQNKLSLEMIHWGSGRVEALNSAAGPGLFPVALRNSTPILTSEVIGTNTFQSGQGRTSQVGTRGGVSPAVGYGEQSLDGGSIQTSTTLNRGEHSSTGLLAGEWDESQPRGLDLQENYLALLLGLSVTPFSHKPRRSGSGEINVTGGAEMAGNAHSDFSNYISEFPDEGAIADALLSRGYAVLRRSPTEVRVRDQGRKREFQILGEKVFTSENKMSVVVLQDADTKHQSSSSELRDPLHQYQRAFGGKEFYVIKGAPSAVLSIVERASEPLQSTREDLAEFEGAGMRLITWAVGLVPPELWDRVPARPPLEDDDAQVKSIADVLFDALHDPTAASMLAPSYLCTTVLTDTLCDDLQLTVAKLRAAGIKLCLITGDSKRAAVSIALQGNLLTPGRHIQTYTLKNLGNLVNDDPAHPRAQRMMYLGAGRVDHGDAGVEYVPGATTAAGGQEGMWDQAEETCLILEGEDADRLCASLLKRPRERPRDRRDPFDSEEGRRQRFINKECRNMCRKMFDRADLVLCCGFTPTQKASVVRLWQLAYREKTCLAVGDGQNDVQMLRQADIGIGITGKEGNSAANNSDVAVTGIRELERLIFVTGHYNFHRCTRFSFYMLYKNLVLASVLMFFSITTLFSAQLVINSVLALVFNTLFNFFPIFVFSLFDRDIPESVLLACPRIFREYKKRQDAPSTAKQMVLLYLNSIYQGCCIYYLSFACLLDGLNLASGHAQDIDVFGYYMISLIVFVTLIECIMEVTNASRLFNLAIAVSLILYISCLLILNYSTFFSDGFFGVLTSTTDSAHFWLCTLATTFAALVPEISARSLIQAYTPTVAQLGREHFGGLSEMQKNNAKQPKREVRPPRAPGIWWHFGTSRAGVATWNKIRKSIDFPNTETRIAALSERYDEAMRAVAVRLGIESVVLPVGTHSCVRVKEEAGESDELRMPPEANKLGGVDAADLSAAKDSLPETREKPDNSASAASTSVCR